MPRPGAPWFWKVKKRWAATIRGKQVLAPKTIAKDDRIAALAWYAATAAAAEVEYVATSVITVADAFEAYLRHSKERVESGDLTCDAYRVIASSLVIAARVPIDGRLFHTLPAADVGVKHLDAVIANWSEGQRRKAPMSRSYQLTTRRKIQTAFHWMVKHGVVPAYNLGGHVPTATKPAETEICSRETAARWLRWLHESARNDEDVQFLLLQRLLIKTGARPSEIHRATWGDVTWAAGATPAGATFGLLTRHEWKLSRKLGRPRQIFLPPTTARALRRRFEAVRPEPGDLIFLDPLGRPWTADSLARRCRWHLNAAAKAGRDFPMKGPGRVRAYMWRHVAASRLIADGVDLPTTAKLLGTSVNMLLKTYVHSDHDRLVAAAMTLASPKRAAKPATAPAADDSSAAAASAPAAARRPAASRLRRPRGIAPRLRPPRAGT